MASSPLSWEELEGPVLRWVLESRQDQLQLFWDRTPSEVTDALSDRQVDDALVRLERHGLIAGTRHEASGTSFWVGLRPTADGLRVLAEWPPVEAATMNVALARILRALADELPDEEQVTATRRAGRAVSRMSGEIVRDIATSEMRRLGGEIAG
jgi:hypothetical protein